MTAPNRAAEVAAVCAQHPEAFGPPPDTNDARRLVLLQTAIIPFLNGLDGNEWGYLVKQDQGGKIPCDILVWRGTLEIFDVMTGTGPCWIPVGRITDPDWIWHAVDTPTPIPPLPKPPDPPPAPVDLSPLLTRIAALEQTVNALASQMPVVASEAEEALHRRLPRYVATKWGITIVSVPEGS
jgi:hypothetical protein